MAIPFSGTYDRKSFDRAIVLALAPRPRQIVLRVVSTGIIALSAVVLVVEMVRQRDFEATRLSVTLLNAILLAVWLIWPVIGRRRAASQAWNSMKANRSLTGEIDSKGIMYWEAGQSVVMPWKDVLRFSETDDVAVLISITAVAVILQRPFFAGDGDWSRFLALARQNVVPVK